jgi:hypothetical protein
MAKVRFVFGRDMTEDQMVDAIMQMVKEHGIRLVDDRKKKKVRNETSQEKERKKE